MENCDDRPEALERSPYGFTLGGGGADGVGS